MSAEVWWARPPSGAPSRPATHSEEAAGLALGPAAPRIVDEADVALGGAIHLPDPNGAEAPLEGLPHFCPESIANRQADFMCLVLWPLQGHPEKGEEGLPLGVPRSPDPGELSWEVTGTCI